MRAILISGLLSLSLLAHAEEPPTTIPKSDDQPVLGHEEQARLFPGDIKIPARIDTGATTNSLYGINPEVYEKDGKDYVRFTFVDHNDKEYEMRRPLVDKITVTQASGEQTRYVVKMGLCVGDHYEETRFTLADRSKMTFPILVGRNYLDNALLVSSAEKNTVSPECDVKVAMND